MTYAEILHTSYLVILLRKIVIYLVGGKFHLHRLFLLLKLTEVTSTQESIWKPLYRFQNKWILWEMNEMNPITCTYIYINNNILAFTLVVNRWKSELCVGNVSVVKIYIIRPKPGPVVKNATPRPSSWESNPRSLDY